MRELPFKQQVISVCNEVGADPLKGNLLSSCGDQLTEGLTNMDQEGRPLDWGGTASLSDSGQFVLQASVVDVVLSLMQPLQEHCGEFRWTAAVVHSGMKMSSRKSVICLLEI